MLLWYQEIFPFTCISVVAFGIGAEKEKTAVSKNVKPGKGKRILDTSMEKDIQLAMMNVRCFLARLHIYEFGIGQRHQSQSRKEQ